MYTSKTTTCVSPPTCTSLENQHGFMAEAIKASYEGMHANIGGPFGCVIVREGVIIAKGTNSVVGDLDPTAHAEINAIRKACKALNSTSLEGCTLYTSCEPCPMCTCAIHWALVDKVYYANTKAETAPLLAVSLQQRIARMPPFERLEGTDAIRAFEEWEIKANKTQY